MTHLRFALTVVSLGVLCTVAQALEYGEKLPELPLQIRTPGQRVLLIMGPTEGDPAKAILDELRVPYEQAASFDKEREDYSGVFAIVAGSNSMDYFGQAENKDPEAFQHIRNFVSEGGHLFLFGSFNGRHMGNIDKFGMRIGSKQNSYVVPEEGHTEVLFHGLEDQIPEDLAIRSCGHIGMAVDYVSMLNRGKGFHEGLTALTTISVDKGRVSLTMIEPYYRDSMWILPVAIHWVVRGAPTTMKQLDQPPVVDVITFRELQASSQQSLEESKQKELRSQVSKRLNLTKIAKDERPDRLLTEADKTDSPEEKYVLLRLAADAYAEIGNADGAFAALFAACNLFKTDKIAEQVRLLKRAAETGKTKEVATENSRLALDNIASAVEAYRFDEAWDFVQLARSESEKAGNERYQRLAGEFLVELEPKYAGWRKVSRTFDKWRANPDDAQANLEVGQFLAFVAEDWEVGVQCLRHGNDASLQDVVKLADTNQDSGLGKVRLADAWMRYAKQLPAPERKAIERRAQHWYRDALEDLSGLSLAEQTRVKRLAERTSTTAAKISISMDLAGYGDLEFRADSLTWTTVSGAVPEEIQIDDQVWDLTQTTQLKNSGSTRYLASSVDLRTIKLRQKKGRGIVRVQEVTNEVVRVRVSDVPSGNDTYEFELLFGQ
ncbi:MAG: hypothetical protein R3C18_20515 [Planctomycetaceae bacterium]